MALTLQAGHFGGERGSFRVVFGDDEQALRGHIIYLAPFGEEMNRCRNAVAEQARRFASRGYRCTVLDLFGTGEALGELADATMEDWVTGIEQCVNDSNAEAPLIFWGCRLGAPLLCHYLQQHPPSQPVDALLWQPLVSGKSFVTQLLRQRAASRMEQGLEKQSKDEVMQMLADGGTLEVGGYALSERLLKAMEALELSVPGDQLGSVHWLEHDTGDGRPIAPKTQRAIDGMQANCSSFTLHRFGGAPFWQLHERDSHEAIVEVTDQCLP